jgi:uncharacterized protein (DUF983 family)
MRKSIGGFACQEEMGQDRGPDVAVGVVMVVVVVVVVVVVAARAGKMGKGRRPEDRRL